MQFHELVQSPLAHRNAACHPFARARLARSWLIFIRSALTGALLSVPVSLSWRWALNQSDSVWSTTPAFWLTQQQFAHPLDQPQRLLLDFKRAPPP